MAFSKSGHVTGTAAMRNQFLLSGYALYIQHCKEKYMPPKFLPQYLLWNHKYELTFKINRPYTGEVLQALRLSEQFSSAMVLGNWCSYHPVNTTMSQKNKDPRTLQIFTEHISPIINTTLRQIHKCTRTWYRLRSCIMSTPGQICEQAKHTTGRSTSWNN